MQRKPTKNTRGPNSAERLFHGWLKEQPCVWRDNPGTSIVDHCEGATFKHNKVLIGHRFCISQCVTCDTEKTIHGKRLGSQSEKWLKLNDDYEDESGIETPREVWAAIQDWRK